MRIYYRRGLDPTQPVGRPWSILDEEEDEDLVRSEHTREGAKILRQRGVDEEIVGAILSHADWNQDEYPRDRPIRKTLFAVDELCGFITAAALIRPSRLEGLGPSSMKKKMKTSSDLNTPAKGPRFSGSAASMKKLSGQFSHTRIGIRMNIRAIGRFARRSSPSMNYADLLPPRP